MASRITSVGFRNHQWSVDYRLRTTVKWYPVLSWTGKNTKNWVHLTPPGLDQNLNRLCCMTSYRPLHQRGKSLEESNITYLNFTKKMLQVSKYYSYNEFTRIGPQYNVLVVLRDITRVILRGTILILGNETESAWMFQFFFIGSWLSALRLRWKFFSLCNNSDRPIFNHFKA